MATVQAILRDSPYVYLPLDDTSGTTATDVSGNARNGTYNNTPTLDVAGPHGLRGVGFTRASSEGVTGSTNYLPTTSDFTVCVWVYPTDANAYAVLGQYYNTFGNRAILSMSGSSPKLLHWQTGGTDYDIAGAVPINVWTHIALTRSSNTFQFYKNGETAGSSGTVSGTVDNQATTIGFYDEAGTNAYSEGRMAHFATWHSLLTASQIRAQYVAVARAGVVVG